MKKLYKEDLWNKILEEVELFSNDKTMKYYFKNNILNFNNFYISEESTTNPSSEALVAHRNDWGIYTFDSSSKAAGYDSIGIREF